MRWAMARGGHGAPGWLAAAVVAGALHGLVTAPARAQVTSPGVPKPRVQAADSASWSSLTPAQQKALGPLQREWPGIDADQRAKWLDLAERLPTMSEADQQRVRARMVQWARMSPRERAQTRAQFQEARQLSPRERQLRWEAYQALPEERRRELAASRKGPDRARPRADDGAATKSSVVRPALPTVPTTVSPSVVRGGPGATTRLVTVPDDPPLHQQAGVPKMPAIPGFVDSNTLLPKRGAQAAGIRPAQPASRPAPSK